MKNIKLFLIVSSLFLMTVSWEAYEAAMRRHTGATAAELRVDFYPDIHQVCDQHHFCTDSTKRAQSAPSEASSAGRSSFETVKPFAHAPMWM